MFENIILIVCYKYNSDSTRLRALNFMLNFYNSNIPELKLLVVEQDKQPTLKSNNLYSIFFIKNNGLFNKAWGFNCGYKQSLNYNYIIFTDSDNILSRKDLIESLNILKNSKLDAISPHRFLWDLNEESTVKLINTNSFKDLTFNNIRKSTSFASGTLIFTKEGFEKIKGWDERFEGWGAEDDLMSLKINTLLKNQILDFTVYHLNHSTFDVQKLLNSLAYQNNCAIWNRFKINFDLEFKNSLSIDQIGNPNKYSK